MKTLAIIVPYRDRPTHLKTFVKYMKKYLTNYGINEFKIFVVEQGDNRPFNRGKLLNIGADLSMKMGYEYLCFHDVDLLPITGDYTYSEFPTSLISEVEDKDGDILFRYFGGVTMFDSEDFKSINGYSNQYWGWGFEDDDLFHRVTHGGLFFDVEKFGINNYSEFYVELIEDDYVKIEINPKMLDNDFEIEITTKVKSKFFDENKDYDEYPIFSIPGYNIGLFYNSFNRYFFQIFDDQKQPYSITTQVIDDITATFKITKRGRRIDLFMDGVYVGDVTMESDVLNLGNRYLYVGAVSDKELVEFDMDVVSLRINDHNVDTNDMVLSGGEIRTDGYVSHQTSIPKPIRRNGIYRELYHDNNSSIEKNWIHKETRNNQIFFNNLVKQNLTNFTEEGLNTLEFETDSVEDYGDYLKITVKL